MKSKSGWRGALAAVGTAAALASSGCIIVADDHDHWEDDWHDDDDFVDPAFDPEPAVAAIDTGASVGALDPGFGAGLFVEVDGAGRWHVFTTCDTELSGYACGWDIDLEAEGIELVDTDSLEIDDGVDLYDGALVAYFVTDSDVDALTFTTAPGADVVLTMLLDGASQPSFVYWVGDGVQNEGAPTNPIRLVPQE